MGFVYFVFMIIVAGVEMPLVEKKNKIKKRKKEAVDWGKNGKLVSIPQHKTPAI